MIVKDPPLVGNMKALSSVDGIYHLYMLISSKMRFIIPNDLVKCITESHDEITSKIFSKHRIQGSPHCGLREHRGLKFQFHTMFQLYSEILTDNSLKIQDFDLNLNLRKKKEVKVGLNPLSNFYHIPISPFFLNLTFLF